MGTVSLRATMEGRELTDPMLEVPGHMVFLLPLRPHEGLLKEVHANTGRWKLPV